MTKKKEEGRPTKYKKAYCAKVLELMEQGKSIVHLAKEFGVCRRTIYQWAEDNEEFSHTLEIGADLAEAFWMDKGSEGLWGGGGGPSFNGSTWKYFMANRFNWREKQEVEQVGDAAITEVKIEGLSVQSNDKSD
jgi:hypothetical protein